MREFEDDNTDDQSICGPVRQYFGFDEFYPNDDDICEEIKLSRDRLETNFLNRFNERQEDVTQPIESPMLIKPEERKYFNC